MSIWSQPSPSDFKRWQTLVQEGQDPGDAARQLGFGGSSTFGRVDPDQHAEVLDLWRDTQRAADRKTARDTLRQIAENTILEPKDRSRAAELLAKASGYLTDRQQVELTGAEGGPVEIEEHRRSLTLADVAALAAQLRPHGSAS